jgi:aspartyl-tRNA(Asn)/glutamyl-tRNA(Gln) amidotransferase subunit A
VAELNPWVNAFAAMNPRAVVAAGESEARWAAGRPMGPLDGVPATVKDLLNMAGFPTRRGSRTTSAEPATEDAPAVLGPEVAGAVIIGKTTTTEFGWKTPGDCPLHGITRNPGTASGRRAAPPPAPARRGRRASGRCTSARTPAAPSASRRPFCGLVG